MRLFDINGLFVEVIFLLGIWFRGDWKWCGCLRIGFFESYFGVRFFRVLELFGKLVLRSGVIGKTIRI